jgi:hypothetical protein
LLLLVILFNDLMLDKLLLLLLQKVLLLLVLEDLLILNEMLLLLSNKLLILELLVLQVKLNWGLHYYILLLINLRYLNLSLLIMLINSMCLRNYIFNELLLLLNQIWRSYLLLSILRLLFEASVI